MPTLLLIHHTPSPDLHALLDSAISAMEIPELSSVTVSRVPALSATPTDVLAADGYVLATPANFGYMSGALKHFFDTCYYPCIDATKNRPVSWWVHGNNDTTGAQRSIHSIVNGLQWRTVATPLELTGGATPANRAAVADVITTVAAHLLD